MLEHVTYDDTRVIAAQVITHEQTKYREIQEYLRDSVRPTQVTILRADPAMVQDSILDSLLLRLVRNVASSSLMTFKLESQLKLPKLSIPTLPKPKPQKELPKFKIVV